MARRLHSTNPEQTQAIGAELAATLCAGDTVVIEGELGTGKTTLIRGACRALGVSVPVTSPTFTIGQRYEAPVPVSHVDLYRVADLAAEEPGLLADYLGADRIGFVEWPPATPPQRTARENDVSAFARIAARVWIEHAGQDRRVLEVMGPSP